MGGALLGLNMIISLADLSLLLVNIIGGGILYIMLVSILDKPILSSTWALIQNFLRNE
jgi:hypothetical protein